MGIYNKVLPYLLVAAGFVCTGCEQDCYSQRQGLSQILKRQ